MPDNKENTRDDELEVIDCGNGYQHIIYPFVIKDKVTGVEYICVLYNQHGVAITPRLRRSSEVVAD